MTAKIIRNVILILAFWAVVAVIGYFALDPEIVPGIGLAAIISLALALYTMLQGWEGTIERIEMRRVKEKWTDSDGHTHTNWRERLIADVRLANGKIKSMPAPKNWQVGDRLVKARGETSMRHITAARP